MDIFCVVDITIVAWYNLYSLNLIFHENFYGGMLYEVCFEIRGQADFL